MAKTAAFDHHVNDYEAWFTMNEYAYASELDAVRYFIPGEAEGIEIGVGTGLFATPFDIRYGVEPSAAMSEKARQKGIEVYNGIAENLPVKDASFDFTLMVTTICFVDDPGKAMQELFRILKPGGRAVIGFVDKDSPIGKQYQAIKEESVFYKEASFFSTAEVLNYLEDAGFSKANTVQTIFGNLQDIKDVQPFKPGYGDGSFVVIAAEKDR